MTDFRSFSQTARPETGAPDLAAPVQGFRAWRLVDGRLLSRTSGASWMDRTLRAACHPQTAEDFVLAPHPAPSAECRCGIRVDFAPDLDVCHTDFRGVVGVVSAWGRVLVGPAQMRAEWARVEALGTSAVWSTRQKHAVAAVAESLGIDLVDVERLEEVALRYAPPLPRTLRPKARASHRELEAASPGDVRELLIAG